MAYPRKFLRLVVSGTLYEVETFSYSMSLIDPSGDANPPDQIPVGVVNAIKTLHTASAPGISQPAKLTMLKLNEIGTDGRYTRPTTVYHEYLPPVAGTGSYNLPAQVALAVSLTTPIKRGRAHAGRFYLPLPGIMPDISGAWHPTNVLNTLTAAKTCLDAINVALDPYKLAVMSNIGEGTFQIVTGVKLGAVLDTIRSRRTKIPEAYQSKTLA